MRLIGPWRPVVQCSPFRRLNMTEETPLPALEAAVHRGLYRWEQVVSSKELTPLTASSPLNHKLIKL